MKSLIESILDSNLADKGTISAEKAQKAMSIIRDVFEKLLNTDKFTIEVWIPEQPDKVRGVMKYKFNASAPNDTKNDYIEQRKYYQEVIVSSVKELKKMNKYLDMDPQEAYSSRPYENRNLFLTNSQPIVNYTDSMISVMGNSNSDFFDMLVGDCFVSTLEEVIKKNKKIIIH